MKDVLLLLKRLQDEIDYKIKNGDLNPFEQARLTGQMDVIIAVVKHICGFQEPGK